MDTGFVKLPRSLLNAEWARNPATLAVFIHLLIEANYEQREWHGRMIPRGAAVTSYRSLAEICGITPRQARTALDKLCAQGYAHKAAHPTKERSAQDSAHPCTIVTICNYDSYNGNSKGERTPKRTPTPPDTAQKTAHKAATPKEIVREYKETYKDIFGEDSRFLPILEDWLSYKKEKGQAYKGSKGLTQFCNRLKGLSSGNPETARQIVCEAMAANYANIYPLKQSTATPRLVTTHPRINIEKTPPEESTSTI